MRLLSLSLSPLVRVCMRTCTDLGCGVENGMTNLGWFESGLCVDIWLWDWVF